MGADLGKSALMRIARLESSLAKVPKRMVTKVRWSGFIEKYTTIGLRISGNGAAERRLHRFCGRTQTYGNQSNVLNSQEPCSR